MLNVRLVPFRISVRDLIPFSGRARRGFSIREVARPNLTQPSRPGPPRPARPWRLNPPCALSHPVSEGKPNANYVRARIRTHVHSDYINEHHRTVLE
jgi:hypothetical protein